MPDIEYATFCITQSTDILANILLAVKIMETEIVLALKEVALDFIKIVGPATVAALATYKTAAYQYKQKITEIEKKDQFKAAEMVFEIQKKSFEDVTSGYKSITNNIFSLSGTLMGDEDLEEVNPYLKKIIEVYTHKLPFAFRKTHREFSVYKDQYKEEYEELLKAEESFNNLGVIDIKKHLDYVIKLEYIYSTLSHCSQIIISEKMNATLSKYTVTN